MRSLGLVTYKHCLERIPLSADYTPSYDFDAAPQNNFPQSSIQCSSIPQSPCHLIEHSSCTAADLFSLPPELHHMIASHLTYPDLLSLKLTSMYFCDLIAPKLTVRMRVHWVQTRQAQRLPVPISSKLSFKSDALFASNFEVNAILRQRREHLECVMYGYSSAEPWNRPSLRRKWRAVYDTSSQLAKSHHRGVKPAW